MSSTEAEQTPLNNPGDGYFAVHTDSIRLDSVPPFALYLRPSADQPYVLYCERKTRFTSDARNRLLQNRITQLFIADADRSVFGHYLTENLADALDDARLTALEKSAILYDSAQAVMADVLEEPTRRENIERGKAVAQKTVNFMRGNDFVLEHLLRTISCDYYLYTHSINVTTYSIALAMRLGYTDSATLREVANGALLHDVGERAIQDMIKNKEGPLSAEEWVEIKRHPAEGLKLLQHTGCLGEIAQDIVLSHHEKLDGTGYPAGLSGDQISPFVRIVTISDIFDALTTERYHQKAMSTFDALKLMGETMRDEIDGRFFRIFVAMMAG